VRNDTFAPLPVFTGSRPIPFSSSGDGVARKDLRKLKHVREALQQLRQEGFTGVHLLQMFFDRQIQPLWRRKTKM
jgi:peptide subunit release factor RF-3